MSWLFAQISSYKCMYIVYTNTIRILPVVVCILPTMTDRIEGFYPAQRAVLIVSLEGHAAGPKYCPPAPHLSQKTCQI